MNRSAICIFLAAALGFGQVLAQPVQPPAKKPKAKPEAPAKTKNPGKAEAASKRASIKPRNRWPYLSWLLAGDFQVANLELVGLSPYDMGSQLFNSQTITSTLEGFNTSFTMQTSTPIERSQGLGSLDYVLGGTLGLRVAKGFHSFEFALGLSGFVPSNTADYVDEMTLTGEQNCVSSCRLKDLGFVGAAGTGTYKLDLVENEKFVVAVPAIAYDFTFRARPRSRAFVGLSAGLIMFSHEKTLDFSASRTDLSSNEATVSRTLEATVGASAANNLGFTGTLYVGFSKLLGSAFGLHAKAGIKYAQLTAEHDITGSMSAILADKVVATLPAESVGYASATTTEISAVGAFLQVGILF